MSLIDFGVCVGKFYYFEIRGKNPSAHDSQVVNLYLHICRRSVFRNAPYLVNFSPGVKVCARVKVFAAVAHRRRTLCAPNFVVDLLLTKKGSADDFYTGGPNTSCGVPECTK